MRSTAILLRQAVRLTLFTRPNCSLCVDVKGVLAKVWERRPFEYDEIDVMKQKKWKSLYEFDVPVVHIDATEENNAAFETTADAQKLKHRLTEMELEKAMDKALESSRPQNS